MSCVYIYYFIFYQLRNAVVIYLNSYILEVLYSIVGEDVVQCLGFDAEDWDTLRL